MAKISNREDALFWFWRSVRRHPHVHPADNKYLKAEKHRFELRVLASPWHGPLKTAPVVLAYVNPGLSRRDFHDARIPTRRAHMVAHYSGTRPLRALSEHPTGVRWTAQRLKHMGDYEALRQLVAIFELIPYHSRSFSSGLAHILPSAEMARRHLREVLMPQAKAGKRFLIVARARKHWGVSWADECDTLRIVENRGGYLKPQIARDVRRWLFREGHLARDQTM